MSERFAPDSIDRDIEELLSPDANGHDARLSHALATLYTPPREVDAALERVHARVLNGFDSEARPVSVGLGTHLMPPPRHRRLKRQLSALGAVAAVLLVTLLAVSLFSGGPILRVRSQPTSTVSLPTPIPVRTPTVSVFSAPGPAENAAVGPDGSLAYIVGVGSGYAVTNHPELVYVTPIGKVTTFKIPTVAGALIGADITMDSNGNVVGETSVYISATKSVKNITWLLNPRSGAVKDLSGGWCPLEGCTLGPDGFFWTYPFTGNVFSSNPTGHYLGVISRIDPDTNRTVSQTPVPAWIRSHVTITAQGATLLFFGVGSGGLTWFSVFDSSHIWLASFNVNSGAFHTIELPRSFTTAPEGSSPGPAEVPASEEEVPVVAPDGSLWDVVQNTTCSACVHVQSTIYRYTPDGYLTSFSNPLPGDGWAQGSQPVSSDPYLSTASYVSDPYSNLCTLVWTSVAPNGTGGGMYTYRCLSPQGVVMTFGQVSGESIPAAADGHPIYTNYHSIWMSGPSAVALIEFPT